jgi:hypothetical protein
VRPFCRRSGRQPNRLWHEPSSQHLAFISLSFNVLLMRRLAFSVIGFFVGLGAAPVEELVVVSDTSTGSWTYAPPPGAFHVAMAANPYIQSIFPFFIEMTGWASSQTKPDVHPQLNKREKTAIILCAARVHTCTRMFCYVRALC